MEEKHDDTNSRLINGIPSWQILAIVFACGGVFYKQTSMEDRQKSDGLVLLSISSRLNASISDQAIVKVSHDNLKNRVDQQEVKIDELRQELWRVKNGSVSGKRG